MPTHERCNYDRQCQQSTYVQIFNDRTKWLHRESLPEATLCTRKTEATSREAELTSRLRGSWPMISRAYIVSRKNGHEEG